MNSKNPKTTVVFHRADYDGLFCREIAHKFLPDAELIGWDFGDKPLNDNMLGTNRLIVLDLPIARVFGVQFKDGWICRGQDQLQPIDRWDSSNLTWIDHHKSAIDTHPKDIPGYRIEGVAACRLALQWFTHGQNKPTTAHQVFLPKKHEFDNRTVREPLAVRLAGEYDVFSPRMKDDPAIELFQCGLNGSHLLPVIWSALLEDIDNTTNAVINNGIPVKKARDDEYAKVIAEQGFDVQWHGVMFLACNSHECDIRSQLFTKGIMPHHEALLGFTFTGSHWRVSMYRIPGKETDVLSIARKYDGGGHPGACGCVIKSLPEFLFVNDVKQ